MTKFFLLVAIVALVLLSSVSFSRRSMNEYDISPGSSLEDVRGVNRKDGVLQWLLNTDNAILSEDRRTARLSVVEMNLPSEGMTINSVAGVYDMESGDLTLNGDVTARTNHYVLSTDNLSLMSDKAEVYTDDRVLIEGDGFKIEGLGLKAYQQKVHLLNDVKAVFF
jgi:LPS export ABC transporter protein LptC